MLDKEKMYIYNLVVKINNKRKEKMKMKMPESLMRVHTKGNLINKKEISIEYALLNIQIKDR